MKHYLVYPNESEVEAAIPVDKPSDESLIQPRRMTND